MSPDPIGINGGLRTNGYVENPSAWIDPWGLSCCLTTGKNFKEHYLKHKSILEKALDKHYPKWKVDEGAEFLSDLKGLIQDGTLKNVGMGTISKNGDVMNIYRGNGMTLITKSANNEFVTLLKSGQGMDLKILFQ